jgi:hypothetical protein
LADGCEVRVAVHAHVDALERLPELRERGIEIQVHTRRNCRKDSLVLQHARHVDQQVGASCEFEDLAAARPRGMICTVDEERGATIKREFVDDAAEASGNLRVGVGRERFDDEHVVPQTPKAEHVLQQRPGCAALIRNAGEAAAHEHVHERTPACSRKRGSTTFESK